MKHPKTHLDLIIYNHSINWTIWPSHTGTILSNLNAIQLIKSFNPKHPLAKQNYTCKSIIIIEVNLIIIVLAIRRKISYIFACSKSVYLLSTYFSYYILFYSCAFYAGQNTHNFLLSVKQFNKHSPYTLHVFQSHYLSGYDTPVFFLGFILRKSRPKGFVEIMIK